MSMGIECDCDNGEQCDRMLNLYRAKSKSFRASLVAGIRMELMFGIPEKNRFTVWVRQIRMGIVKKWNSVCPFNP